MKFINNENGIALITSLMLTMISLVIVLALMYMITSSIQVSSANKRYRTVLQAAYGATDIVTKDVIKRVFEGMSTATKLESAYNGTLSGFSVNSCINQKFNRSTSSWDSACIPTSFSPKNSPDITFLLQATTNTPFKVYAKIVDTSAGNTDTANNQNLKEATNITDTTVDSGLTIPSSYRIEVQTERQNSPDEKANLSVLYAY